MRLVRPLLLALLLVPAHAAAQPDPGDLVINEILYAPDPSSNEFIELLNRSGRTIDLAACTYADGNLDFDPIADTETLVASDGFAVLARDPAAFSAAFPAVEFVAPPDWEGLNNGGDRVEIRCGAATMDVVDYDDRWGGADGASLERIDPAGASTDPANFGTSVADAGATPGAPNSLFAPDTAPPALDAASATPSADTVVAIFSEALAPASVTADRFRMEPTPAPGVRVAQIDSTDRRRVRLALAQPLGTGSYTLVASNLEDPSGNLLVEGRAAFSVVRPDAPTARDVVVNEIQYAPSGDDSEFVELLNRSAKTFDLRQFTLSDDRDVPVPLVSTARPLQPGEFVVLVADAAPFADAFPAVDAIEVAGWPALNNSGDAPTLRADGVVIDVVPYAPSWGGTDGASLERVDPAGPSDSPFNFGPSTASDGATPGATNSLFAPDTTPPIPTFAEATGPTTVTVYFDEPLAAASVVPSAFALDGRRPQSVVLADATVVDLDIGSALDGDTLDITGIKDRTDNAIASATVPLAVQPAPGDLVVNEILFDPRADAFDERPDQPEYVELFSLSDRPLTLHRAFVTDRPTETGAADTTHLVQRVALPPGGWAVVFADPDARPDPALSSLLTRAFPSLDASADDVVLLPFDARSLSLNNGGDAVRVHRADGTRIDTVRYTPDWHAEALDDTKGTALERISATGPAGAPDNWTSSAAPSGGTPGQANATRIAPAAPLPEPTLSVTPSPFSIERDGGTRIQFALNTVPSVVRCRIFDALGRPVRTLEAAQLTGRTGEIVWNGRGDDAERLRMGVYVVLLEAVSAETGSVARMQEPVVLARPFE